MEGAGRGRNAAQNSRKGTNTRGPRWLGPVENQGGENPEDGDPRGVIQETQAGLGDTVGALSPAPGQVPSDLLDLSLHQLHLPHPSHRNHSGHRPLPQPHVQEMHTVQRPLGSPG